MLSTTQITDSDANKHVDPKNPSPATGDQITDSDITKQHDPTHDSTASSTTKVKTSDHNESDTKNQLTDDTDSFTPTDKPKNYVDPAIIDKSRKDLENLIEQDLKYVNDISPRLGQHGQYVKKKVDEARKKFEELKKSRHEIKDLKDLKKDVTKILLQIPAKYRTYVDESERQKKKQTDLENNVVSGKILKELPKYHDTLFHKSPFCKTIQKRYNDLRRELKLCLLCFTVFPENAKISRRLMVYWWIGEGLITISEDGKTTAEDYGNRLFNELMDNDFIEPVSKRHDHRNVAFCRMNPMVRAALVMIADEIKFFDFDEYGNPKDFGKFDEFESPEDMPVIFPIGPVSDPREFFDFYDENRKWIPPTERIDFHDSKGNRIPFASLTDSLEQVVDRDGKPIDAKQKYYFYSKKEISKRLYKVCLMGSGLSNGITWEKLHVLFNVKDDILGFKPEWFLRMKNVDVLFLGRWQSSAAHHIEVEDFDFKDSLDHMSHVRFFSLQGVSRLSEIPKSISKLESLLILDLRACHNLEVIPKTIGSLKWLTHLDMSECYLLKDMPKEISSLLFLQVLKGFVVEEDSQGKQNCTLQDLKKLENLRKLSMYTHMKNFPQDSHLDALRELPMLRKLTILWSVHGSKNKDGQSKQDVDQSTPQKGEKQQQQQQKGEKDAGNTRKDNNPKHAWRRAARLLISQKKQWVKGTIRRMNAFNTLTLGSQLEKLDLKCFPNSVTPNWLTPSSLKGLKKLYIRGGEFSDIGQYQNILDIRTHNETWNVEVLRLKYLDELKIDWRELQDLFPKMTSLEKVKCPWLTLFPCNEHGIWTKKTSTTT